MFPDCLSERVRYMRVAPIDLSNDLIYRSVMKAAVSLKASALLTCKVLEGMQIRQIVGALRE